MAKHKIFIGFILVIITFLFLVILAWWFLPVGTKLCPSCYLMAPPIEQPIIPAYQPTDVSPSPNAEHFRNLNIKPGDTITSPLKITGESGGGWFFEGSFPINLVDWDGKIIATGLAQAKSDWMTTDFVPFEAELTFTKPANLTNQDYAKKGAIIFRKDNPSGKPEFDAAYELPIKF